jgi:DNA-binding transcriptional regulator LsrR (DeoR family)
MPRVNIYLPADVYELTKQWRSSANLSEICARAIRDEFEAADTHRAPLKLLNAVAPPSIIERELVAKYSLEEALVVDAPEDPAHAREQLGFAAATYLDRTVSDGSMIAFAGGRQTWCMVRALMPRRVRSTIVALGVGNADPKLLHAHANTLVTLAWLAYSPRSEAHVVGAAPGELWDLDRSLLDYPSCFLFGSCSPFDPSSSFAQVLGAQSTSYLTEKGVVADFAYAFMDAKGDPIAFRPDAPHSLLAAPHLHELSRRSDTRIVLIAGGEAKLQPMLLTLSSRLCNMLITDRNTARTLLS